MIPASDKTDQEGTVMGIFPLTARDCIERSPTDDISICILGEIRNKISSIVSRDKSEDSYPIEFSRRSSFDSLIVLISLYSKLNSQMGLSISRSWIGCLMMCIDERWTSGARIHFDQEPQATVDIQLALKLIVAKALGGSIAENLGISYSKRSLVERYRNVYSILYGTGPTTRWKIVFEVDTEADFPNHFMLDVGNIDKYIMTS